jgi:adenylyltransferase/sulfurtransferase
LAGAGVGSLTLVDFDVVEESNLHRQVIHDTAGAHGNTHKADSASARVAALNPFISCDTVKEKLTRSNVIEIMTRKQYDLVVDATDNFDARYVINDACNQVEVPLVSGSAGESLNGALRCFALG